MADSRWIRVVERLSGIAGVIGATALVLITLGITTDVVMRQVTGGSVPGLLEVTELFMATAVFMGLAAAQRDGGQIRVEVATSRLSAARARASRLFSLLVTLVVAGAMVWTSWGAFLTSYSTGEARWGLLSVPLWPGRLAVVIGCFLLALQTLVSLSRSFQDPRGEYTHAAIDDAI